MIRSSISRYARNPDKAKEWADYTRSLPNGEDVLTAAVLWLGYLQGQPSRPAVRIRSYEYARRLLHTVVGGERGSKLRLGYYWNQRLKEFGLSYNEYAREITVTDSYRWAHALSILRKTGRLPYRYFLWRLESGAHPDDPIDRNDLPPLKHTNRRVVWPAGQPYQDREEKMLSGSGGGNGWDWYNQPQQPQNSVQSFMNRIQNEM